MNYNDKLTPTQVPPQWEDFDIQGNCNHEICKKGRCIRCNYYVGCPCQQDHDCGTPQGDGCIVCSECWCDRPKEALT